MKLRFLTGAAALCGLAFAGTAAAQSGAVVGNKFNPAVGLVLQGHFAEQSSDYPSGAQPGFLVGGEGGDGIASGFSLDESELYFSANVDDLFYAQSNISLHDGSAEVEEAFVQPLTMPEGLGLKFGKFYSDFAYQNARHSHTWDFIDQPLAYAALLGNQYKDPGVQLTWLAPTDTYIQLGTEYFRGDEFPAGNSPKDGKGAYTLFAKFGGDVGYSNNWQASIGRLHYNAMNRESVMPSATIGFTGSGNVDVIGAVWKWSPHGNWHDRNFIIQGEYLRRDESGQVASFAEAGQYDGTQSGWYLQGVYQWVTRWRAGLRYDRLHADNAVSGLIDPTAFIPAAQAPERVSAMLDYSNSEFSRIRLQVSRNRGAEGSGTGIYLQYIMALGAHGAHSF